MPSQGQKGKRRRKPPKPYDKPKGFITKVKDFFNPWAWSKPLDKGTGDVPIQEEDAVSNDSDSDKFESAPSSPVEGHAGAPGGSGDLGSTLLTPSIPQYHSSNDPRYTSFTSKADIGSLSADILSDQRVQSIFGNVNYEAGHHPRSFHDISSQALMPSDISTRATAGSDSSSQPSISEVDPSETGSVSSIGRGAVAKGDKLGESSLARKYLSTSLVSGNRGRLSLHTQRSSLQSLREGQTPQRRSFLADSSVSTNLLTSTPRLAEERWGHQVATPLPSVQALQSTTEGGTAQASGTAGEEALARDSPGPSLPAFVTPTRQRGSLSRTPFNSPFYQSGRTPYFGTGQKKRGRPESPSSPELPPLRQKVTAKPLASTSATTQTAKKILQALESISSPLENVRRLPPRLPVQPLAKRRKAELTDALAPPTEPLQSAVPVRLLPPVSTNPQTGAAAFSVLSGGVKLPSASTSNQPPKPPLFTASTSPPSSLSGTKPHTTQLRRQGAVMGKMPSPRRQRADGQDLSPLDNNNPLELPPPIQLMGLKSAPKLNIVTTQSFPQLNTTSTNDSLKMAPPPPVFSSTLGAPSLFHQTTAQGTVLQPSSSTSLHPKTTTTKLTVHVTAPKALSRGSHVTPPKATPSSSLGAPFTFAPPTQMSPARITTENCNKPFVFSPPQVRVGVSAQASPPLLSSTSKGPPPQLPQSALDALNKFKEAGEKMAAEDEANPEVIALSSDDEDNEDMTGAVNLTASSKKEEAGKGEQKPLTFKPLAHLAPPTGSWSCDTCLVNNKEGDDKCCACGAAKPGEPKSTIPSSLSAPAKVPPLLGTSTAQWTCDTCLVPNKEDAEQCVCCGAKRPGSAPSKLAAPPKMPPLAPIKPLAPLDKGGGGGGDGEWSCETCLVPNKNSDNKCVCCGGSKPGEKVESQTASNVALAPAGGLKLNFPVASSNLGGLKLNFPVASSNSGGLKLNFPLPTSSSDAGAPLGGAGGLKLNFPIPKAETSTAAPSTEGPKLSTGGVGFGLKFPMAATSTSVTSGELKLSTGGLKFSTGGLGAFMQTVSSSSEPQKVGSSGSTGFQKSVTFKLDEDAKGEVGAAQETGPEAVKGLAPPTSGSSSQPLGQSAEGGIKLGGVGGLPLTTGAMSTGAQLDKGEPGGGSKLGGVTMAAPGGSLKLGGLDGPVSISKLGSVTMAKSDLSVSVKAGGATTTAPGLSGGLKLGDASSSGALFKGANLSFSNNSNIAPSGGLKLNNLPLLPVATATVSKETASGVPAVGGLSSSGTALGSEGAQQSSTVGFAFGADGVKPGLLSQSTPSTEAKSSGLVFGGLNEGVTEQKAATSSSTGLQVPSFLSTFQKEETNLFAASLKSDASLEQKLSNSNPLKVVVSSSSVPTLGGGVGLFPSPGLKPFTPAVGGTAPQLTLGGLPSAPTASASGLSNSTQGGGLFSQPPTGLQLSRNAELPNAGSLGLPESKPLQVLNAGPVGGTTAPFQFGIQGSSGTPSDSPFAASLTAQPSLQSQPPSLSSTTLNFFGQPSAATTQQAPSGGFAGGLALGGQKPLGGGGSGGVFPGLQGPSTLQSSTSAGTAPTFKFGEANPTPNFTFGGGNANPLLPQSADNPFLSNKSPSATLNFTSTDTVQGTNMFSPAAVKNTRIVKKAVRRGKR